MTIDDGNIDIFVHARPQHGENDESDEQQQEHPNKDSVVVVVQDNDDDDDDDVNDDDTVPSDADDEEYGLLLQRQKKKSTKKSSVQQQAVVVPRFENNNNTVMNTSVRKVIFLITVILIAVGTVQYLVTDTVELEREIDGGTEGIIVNGEMESKVGNKNNNSSSTVIDQVQKEEDQPPPPPTSESELTAASGQEQGQQPLVVETVPEMGPTVGVPSGGQTEEPSSGAGKEAEAEAKPVPPPTEQQKQQQQQPQDLVFTDDDYVVHVVYNDLQYRRVCAPVHASILCLTVKYPFLIPSQDESVPYVKPFNEEIYALTANHFHFIDGDDQLGSCISNATSIGMPIMTSTATTTTGEADGIKMCIDHHHEHTYGLQTVVGVWNRVRLQQSPTTGLAMSTSTLATLYGVQHDGQTKRRRVHSFFNNQIVIMLGASPTLLIQIGITSLFGSCKDIQHFDGMVYGAEVPPYSKPGKHMFLCYPSGTSAASKATNWNEIDTTNVGDLDDNDGNDDWTFLFRSGFYPHDSRSGDHWIDPGTTVDTELIRWKDVSKWNDVRFTIIVEHPIAHMQNQNTMMSKWKFLETLQDEWTQVFLNSSTPGPRNDDLVGKGMHIMNVIAFDGSPQFFPSYSGSYPLDLARFHSEEDLIGHDGYDGWIPDYGTKCRGFLPPTSNLTRYNNLGRYYYEKNGLDMRWYGRTWEFINLVWFSVAGSQGYGRNGLDCTHGSGPFSQMHTFFLMAMIDDHYDNL